MKDVGPLNACFPPATPARTENPYNEEAGLCEAPQGWEAISFFSAPPGRGLGPRARNDTHAPSGLGMGALFMSPAFLLLGAAGCDSALRIRPCDTLRFGECDDVCDKVPIAVTAQPLYDLDLAVEARSALAYVSTQNPCLLDGLNGVSFADMDGHGSYLTTKEEIQINPLVVPADVKNTADYRFILLYRLYHELGHHVFNYVFGQRCTDIGYEFMHISWNDYYGMKPGMDTDVDHGDFLNADAVRTADEDFAVCFAYYVFLPGEFQKRIAERGAAHPALAQKYAVLKELFDGMEFPIVAPAFVTTAHAHACTTPRGEAWSLRQPLVLKGS